MKKSNLLIVAILLLITFKSANAQLGIADRDDIVALTSRNIIVIVSEPSEKFMKKLTKKNKIDDISG